MTRLTLIKTTGPIPVASYMRQCLTSDLGGYYSSAIPTSHDQFGVKGDFVTSPQISQIFGELIGIWVVAEWIAQGKKKEGVYLMEMGPGRGTLMDDMLRTIYNFPALAKALEAVYMVESSPNLRQAQHKLLCGRNELKEIDIGWESMSKYSPGLKIIWAEDMRLVPREAEKTPFIIAHEFFDALPIHVFQSLTPPPQKAESTIQTPTGPVKAHGRIPKRQQWRELVVSPKPPHRLKQGEPEFELTMSKTATPYSMYLPETSSRYKALRDIDGATIEISPDSQAFVRDFAIRIGGSTPAQAVAQIKSPPSSHTGQSASKEESLLKAHPSGAALIIDYGPAATVPANSLRGIKQHKLVSPFESPGTTDISADVDFLALAECAIDASLGVEVHGPVDQARFLRAMGIEERAAQLVKLAVDQERSRSSGQDKKDLTELVKTIESGWRRLVDTGPQGMGRLYQIMAILPYHPPQDGSPRRRPVGFGGDVNI